MNKYCTSYSKLQKMWTKGEIYLKGYGRVKIWYLARVNIALDDVQDGNVAMLDIFRLVRPIHGNHHVFWLQQASHDVQNTGFLNICRLKHQDSAKNPIFQRFATCCSAVNGVKPVIRKCNRGVGISEAMRLTRSLFM